MGYAHIDNLYRPEAQQILLFKRVYALEKVHGTSAHVSWTKGVLHFFSGGEKHENFVKLFDHDKLAEAFRAEGLEECIVFGEAYGGKMQGMSKVYGPKLRFIAFDVLVGKSWLSVPAAAALARKLGFDFVPYELVTTDIETLDAERDKPSLVSINNGLVDGATYDSSKREGVVLRPPFEVRTNCGARVCAKHKRAEFCERKTPQKVDEKQREVLEQADAIADEWVTEMRLTHVLDKLGNPNTFDAIPAVVSAMVEDVIREASGEIVDSKPARRAISTKAVALYKRRITQVRDPENQE